MHSSLPDAHMEHGMQVILSLVLLLASLFQAAGQIKSFPYTESFDAATLPGLPPAWISSQKRSAGVSDFGTTSSSPNSIPYALIATNATIPQWLQSPEFDFRGLVPDTLRFYVRRSSSFAALLVIEAATDGGRTFGIPIGDTLRPDGQSNYVRIALPLPRSLADYEHVAIRWRIIPAGTGSTATLRIDDVRISAGAVHDLALNRVVVSPGLPSAGDSLFLHVSLSNAGSAEISQASVTAFVCSERDSHTLSYDRIVTERYAGSLIPGDSTVMKLALGCLHAGTWVIRVSGSLLGDQDSTNNDLNCLVDVGVPFGTVVVNEIQYLPAAGEPEWVELFNAGREPIDLHGWTLSDAQVDAKKVLESGDLSLPPGGLAVVTADSHAMRLIHPGLWERLVQIPTFPSLNNGGDAVVLSDRHGRVIDSVRYEPAWGGGSGVTLERIDPLGASNSASNWSSCGDSMKGTPGKPNTVAIRETDMRSVRLFAEGTPSAGSGDVAVVVQNVGRQPVFGFRVVIYDDVNSDSVGSPEEELAVLEESITIVPHDSIAVKFVGLPLVEGLHQLVAEVLLSGDQRNRNNRSTARVVVRIAEGAIRVNEIMYDPLEGNAEYVEVANASGRVVDVWSCVIHDRPTAGGTTNRFTLASTSLRLKPGEFYVLASDSSVFDRFPEIARRGAERVRCVGQSNLGLNNDGDVVYVDGPDTVLVDSVAFLPSWHNPDLGTASGRALEKIAPRLESSNSRNWASSVHPAGGTPGWQNSVYAGVVPVAGALSFAPNPFSPDDDGSNDVVVLRYELPLPASIIRVRIFDVAGRHIRTLQNGAPAGSSGELIWDGRDDTQRRARIGMYVVCLEAVGGGGEVIVETKGVVVLATRL